MKKYFYLFVAAIAAITFVSCNGNNNNDPDDPNNKKADVTFNITISDITYNGATFDVTPSNDTIKYFWSVLSKEDLADYFDGDIDSLASYYLEYYAEQYEEYVDYYGQETMESYGMGDVASFLEYYGLVVTGEDSYTYEDLDPETNYIVFAFAYDATNNAVSSDITSKEFTTAAVSNVDLTFSYTVNDTALFIIPSDDNTTWLGTYYDNDSLDDYGYSDATSYFNAYLDYVAEYEAYYASYGYDWSYFLYTGPIYLLLSDMEEGHTYTFVCAAVASGTINSEITTFQYPSAASIAPANIQAKKATKNVKELAPAQKFNLKARKPLSVMK